MAKMQIGNEEVEGEFVPFHPIEEDWNEYSVGGYIVKIKLIIKSVSPFHHPRFFYSSIFQMNNPFCMSN